MFVMYIYGVNISAYISGEEKSGVHHHHTYVRTVHVENIAMGA